MESILSKELLSNFILAFIPLFVAMEPIGVIPIYVAMTEPLGHREKREVLLYSIITATVITLAFLFVGKAVFRALGITVSDFQIAGGLVLLCIAIYDIIITSQGKIIVTPDSGVGIVPLGTPIIAGPAALTTLIILQDLYGLAPTILALVVNLFIIWLVFTQSEFIVRRISSNGTRGISKVISLLLAAIAVMMIRKGIQGIFS